MLIDASIRKIATEMEGTSLLAKLDGGHLIALEASLLRLRATLCSLIIHELCFPTFYKKVITL